ncbi:MAG: sigma-70 family RNA polymerase sigma factor [Chitinophagaceae bacterium]
MSSSQLNVITTQQGVKENPQYSQQFALGEPCAFEWVYKNYFKKLYNYVYLLTADKALSEDIVQDVFLTILENKEKLVNVSNINSYLYASARNRLVSLWRNQKIKKIHLTKISAIFQRHTEVIPLLEREKVKIVSEAILSLTPRQRLIYVLTREEGWTREKISKTLQVSPFTVKNTMQNALKGIKERVSEYELCE